MKIMAKKTTTKSKPEAVAKRAAKPAEKPKAAPTPPPKPVAVVAAPKLKPVKTPPKAKRVVKKAAPKPPAFTQNDVALKAYYISEKRRSEGLPGDEHQDWLEAERQIAAEFSKKKTAKKV
jgi:hypothetical protein